MRSVLICFAWFLSLNAPASGRAAEPGTVLEREQLTEAVRNQAVNTLRSGLREAEEWTKVHAAEFLLELGLTRDVRDVFEAERTRRGQESPYRIGIWRVLAKAGRTAEERQSYVDRLLAAALDPDGPDRLHAIESLAKLGVALEPNDAAVIADWATAATTEQTPFADWLLCFSAVRSGDRGDRERRLVAGLDGRPLTRLRAAVAIAGLPSRTDATESALIAAANRAAREKSSTGLPRLADAYLIASAWHVASPDDEASPEIEGGSAVVVQVYHRTLKRLAEDASDVAVVFANALARRGEFSDARWLVDQLDNEATEMRLSAAHAVLRIDRRRSAGVTGVD